MGFCCSARCLNTPHAWQMGWISVQQLSGAQLAAGQPLGLRLASQAVNASSGARIRPTWVAGATPVFLGYRTRQRGDAQLGPGLADRVHLYTSPIAGTLDAAPTVWLGALAGERAPPSPRPGACSELRSRPHARSASPRRPQPLAQSTPRPPAVCAAVGQTLRYPAGKLVVQRAANAADGAAVVSVCRVAGNETAASCRRGFDFDCNGLVGADDPGCAALALASSGR